MDAGNQTGVLEFLLLGLSEDPELQSLLFGLFLSMYLVSVLGNLLNLAVSSDSRLHTPMYFFLSHLSFSDICFNFTIIPKMLVNIQTASKDFTYAGCITQMYFYLVFFYLDHFLLTVMAYVHFVAICHSLHYVIMMNSHLCCLLALVSLSLSFLIALLYSLMVLCLSFCTHIEIPHFFCELTEVLQSSCSDALSYYIVLFSVTGLLGMSSSRGTVASVMCTVLKTFFYSLRNRDIPGALRTFVSRSFSPS